MEGDEAETGTVTAATVVEAKVTMNSESHMCGSIGEVSGGRRSSEVRG